TNDLLPAGTADNIDGHTDIAQALELASNSGERSLATRIVLLSDGNETRSSALESLDRIADERLSVDVLPNEPPTGSEAALSEFKTPAQAFNGEELDFSMIIEADQQSTGEIVLSVNDREIDRVAVELDEGRNILTHTYTAD